ncbi:proton-coupled amino acid transporter-like protein pathetic [Frankliniella occidentalis]|uniref:Proton-coupled amino acid transporter-like protein pathetic n=1 Tax=Frankliniella occidentalis TaxID=133901 RepID=A0A9C6X5E5_FRAOC|nr:proton-coupled amino acid transporter-like protein pathetic [Frankliniella occidentalis]
MSGLGVGVASGVVIAIVCTHCCTLLVESSRVVCRRLRVPSLDFPSTVEAAFLTGHARFRRYARLCRFMVNFMLCFTYLGLPIIFIVVISSSVQQLVQHYTLYELNVRYYILMLIPFVLAMGLVRDLKWLVPLSHTSNTLFLAGLSITMYYVLKDAPSPLTARQTGTLGDYPLFLSAMIYGMENIGVILPVENTMRNPKNLVAGPNVLIWSMSIIAFCYIFIGAAGFLTFGEATRENIILNLPISEPAAQAVKVIIPLGVLLSYGLQLYVVPMTLWSGLRHRVPEARRNAALNLLRAATVLFTVVVALVVPNLRPVLALVGAVGFSTLGLLFPALVDLVVHWRSASALRVTKDVLIMLFWLVALLAGTYSALLEIMDTYFTEPQAA